MTKHFRSTRLTHSRRREISLHRTKRAFPLLIPDFSQQYQQNKEETPDPGILNGMLAMGGNQIFVGSPNQDENGNLNDFSMPLLPQSSPPTRTAPARTNEVTQVLLRPTSAIQISSAPSRTSQSIARSTSKLSSILGATSATITSLTHTTSTSTATTSVAEAAASQGTISSFFKVIGSSSAYIILAIVISVALFVILVALISFSFRRTWLKRQERKAMSFDADAVSAWHWDTADTKKDWAAASDCSRKSLESVQPDDPYSPNLMAAASIPLPPSVLASPTPAAFPLTGRRSFSAPHTPPPVSSNDCFTPIPMRRPFRASLNYGPARPYTPSPLSRSTTPALHALSPIVGEAVSFSEEFASHSHHQEDEHKYRHSYAGSDDMSQGYTSPKFSESEMGGWKSMQRAMSCKSSVWSDTGETEAQTDARELLKIRNSLTR